MSLYLTLEQLINILPEGQRNSCLRILSQSPGIIYARGSSGEHHSWPGGYLDHIQEVMNIAKALYTNLADLRPLPFTLADALIVLYVHDLEKPWKYIMTEQGLSIKPELLDVTSQEKFRENMMLVHGLVLTDVQKEALQLMENIWGHTAKQSQNSLAVFCNTCNRISSEVWPDRPLEKDEPWGQRFGLK